jgi:sporulation protein YlmC with PRC-barrel domain
MRPIATRGSSASSPAGTPRWQPRNGMTLAHMLSGATVVILTLVMPGLATAQQDGAELSQYWEAEDDSLSVEPFNLTVGQIDHMEIVSATGERIGEVDEVLMNASGKVAAVMVEAGDKEVVVELHEFRVDGRRLVTTITKTEIEALGVTDPDEEPGLVDDSDEDELIAPPSDAGTI